MPPQPAHRSTSLPISVPDTHESQPIAVQMIERGISDGYVEKRRHAVAILRLICSFR